MNSEPDYEFLKVMRTYVDVNYPFREVVSLNVDKKCFGRLGIKMQIADRSKEISIGKENVFSDYSFEKFKNIMVPNSLLMNKVNRFINDEDKNNLIKKI